MLKMTNKILKLPDTSLCAIVRDEERNPAGGIERWLRQTLPFFYHGVVVDTGSTDNTRKILADLQKQFPYLQVFDHVFDGFSTSRNFSLSKVQTKRAFVMDADELLMPEDYLMLLRFMEKNPVERYEFEFQHINENGYVANGYGLNPRLFDVNGANFHHNAGFISDCYELFMGVGKTLNVPVAIKHFLPPNNAVHRKKDGWYHGGVFRKSTPLENARENGWKEYNPQRDKYDWCCVR